MSARAGRRGPPPGHRGTTSGQRGTPPGHGTGPVGLLLIDGNNLLHRTVGRVDGPARHGLL
ncbi:MAG TPA: hypothetical protein VFW86_00890, partial [Candidatus Limnocylindrales bacterium]|nr:hypothetical protein [Candidatus Limnocylindrales bacterium]